MSHSITNRPIVTRPAFVVANPHLREAHVNAQREMFASARTAGLSTRPEARDEMIEAINAALGLRGSGRLISRRQMTIAEMQAVSVAIDAGLFGYDCAWAWNEEFSVSVRSVQMDVVHFEPINTQRVAFSMPLRPTALSPLR